MGRFDVRSLAERVRRGAVASDRTARFAAHLHSNPPSCACRFSERHPVSCLCCGKTMCFACGGVVDLSYLSEYLNRRNRDFAGEFDFDDKLGKV